MPDPDSPDPYEAGWRPTYIGGDEDLGNVGVDFGADLYELFRAGRVYFPETAREYYWLARRVQRTESVLSTLFAEGSAASEPAYQRILELRDQLQEVLAESSVNIDESGTALVHLAARYAASEEETAAEFAAKMDQDSEHSVYYDQGHRVTVPTLPASDDPQTHHPDPADGHLAPGYPG